MSNSNLADPGIENVPEKQLDSYLTNAKAHVPGIENEKVIEYYTEWANRYDLDLNSDVYHGPRVAADKVNELYSSNKEAKILDIGAGTGFVGEILKNNHGFVNVDALEPSKGMLDLAVQKNVYKNHYLEGIQPDRQTSLSSESYDVVVLAGAMGEGHIKSEGMHELARLTKSNGHVIVVMREEYLSYVKEYVNRLEPIMREIESNGTWKMVSRQIVENYSFNKNGVVFTFQKC